jgi:hypothetical protein
LEDAKLGESGVDIFAKLKEKGKSLTFDFKGIPMIQFP